MSISGVAAVSPVAPPRPIDTSTQAKSRKDDDQSKDVSYTPPPKPPLPPGQGTRIDQLA
jgi:hypothetical protein